MEGEKGDVVDVAARYPGQVVSYTETTHKFRFKLTEVRMQLVAHPIASKATATHAHIRKAHPRPLARNNTRSN